jgi:hypothetical protein
MKQEDRIRLFRLANERLGRETPTGDALAIKLNGYADDLGLEPGWRDTKLEFRQLAREFLVLRSALLPDQADRPPVVAERQLQPAPDGGGFFPLLGRPQADLNQFFRAQDNISYKDLHAKFGRWRDIHEDAGTGTIDIDVIDALLQHLQARPLDNPRDFVTDPDLGVLDDAQMAELYRRDTGA